MATILPGRWNWSDHIGPTNILAGVSEDGDVGQQLQALVLERGIEAGERLPAERDLASELGISRAALREGLRGLIDLGVLEARRGSGTYLAGVDLDDLFAVRLRLEPYAAGLAARRRGAGDLARFEQLLSALRAVEGDARRFAAADASLHEAIVIAARSSTLRTLLDALADMLRYSRARTAPDPVTRAETLRHLEALVAAIAATDRAG